MERPQYYVSARSVVKDSSDVIGTGSPVLDLLMGIGGYPRGEITELFGEPDSGKSTLALQAIAEAQRAGLKAAYFDVEHSLAADYAEALGVDINALMYYRPATAEAVFLKVLELAQGRIVDLIVVDSLAAMLPETEFSAAIGETASGGQMDVLRKWLPTIWSACHNHNICMIATNQLRYTQIGDMMIEKSVGYDIVEFNCAIRFELFADKLLCRKEVAYARRCRVKVVKNIFGKVDNTATVNLYFDGGIKPDLELIAEAVKLGVLQRNDNDILLSGKPVGRGIRGATQYFSTHPIELGAISRIVAYIGQSHR